jgi:hypothetical protein
MFLIALYLGVVDPTANEALGVKDRVHRVAVERILGGIANSLYGVNATVK